MGLLDGMDIRSFIPQVSGGVLDGTVSRTEAPDADTPYVPYSWQTPNPDGTYTEVYKVDSTPPSEKVTWNSIDPAAWNYVSDATKESYGFTNSTSYKVRINEAAAKFHGRTGVWPSATELLADETYQRYMGNLKSKMPTLPVTFAVDNQVYYNDPFTGPQWVFTAGETYLGSLAGDGGGLRSSGPREPPIDNSAEIAALSNPMGAPSGPMGLPKFNWTRDEFVSIMTNMGPAHGPSGPSGSGAAGRTTIPFDRADLIEQASDRWRGLMLEEGDNIEGIVDAYIDASNAFWIGEAGRLDFDTFLVNKARETGRYKQLYSRLPSHQTEEEYIAGFRQTSERFGLNPTVTRRETVAGAEAGVGLAGFSDRVSRTREARLANTGGFSQQLASTFGAMPGLAGS
jgi:hypothetical protein